MSTMWRSRWAAVGAAVAITLGAGGIGLVQATTSTGEKPIYKPINPCRLADIRPAPDTVGPRTSPLGPDESYTLSGWGAVGNCNLPNGTAGLALNVTAISPSQATFLTLHPTGVPLPLTSNLNPTPGQPPTPNAVNVDLNAAGQFNIFNKFGTVYVIVDVVGYYDDHNHDDRYYTEAEADANDLWAVVRADGVLARGSNVTSAGTTAGGGYEVIFNRNVTQCAFVPIAGNVAGGNPLTRFAGVASRDGNANGVHVRVWDVAGVLKQDSSFHLTVHC